MITLATYDAHGRAPRVVDRIGECHAINRRALVPASVRYVVVHRISLALKTDDNPYPIPDHLLDGPALVGRFARPALGTGGACPYHVLVRYDGTAEQLIPMSVMGAHAVNYNGCSWGVACVGDTRKRPLRDRQWEALREVCRRLAVHNGGLDIVGHTSLSNGSHDPGKVCPGEYLSVDALEREVASSLPDGWQRLSEEMQRDWLTGTGLVM